LKDLTKGYYWVKYNNHWGIGYYGYGMFAGTENWMLVGLGDRLIKSEDFLEIGDRIERKEK
jgi:hypothetical protein